MTDEERKASNREKMRKYRLRHANDPEYKARVKDEKRRQWAKNPEHHKEVMRRLQKRYRDKNKDKPSYKEKAIKLAKEWRKKYPERERKAKARWAQEHPEKVKDVARRYRERNPDAYRKYADKHPELIRFWASTRRARIIKATPSWANLEAIEKVFAETERLSKETGILYHVDHIIPLKHELVCGLHVHWNLQALPASENLRKSNRFTPH